MYVASKQRFMNLQRSDLEQLSHKELLQIANYGRRTVNTYIRHIENEGLDLALVNIPFDRIPLNSKTMTSNELIAKIESIQEIWSSDSLKTSTAREQHAEIAQLISDIGMDREEFVDFYRNDNGWIDLVVNQFDYDSDLAYEMIQEYDETQKFEYIREVAKRARERSEMEAEMLGLR